MYWSLLVSKLNGSAHTCKHTPGMRMQQRTNSYGLSPSVDCNNISNLDGATCAPQEYIIMCYECVAISTTERFDLSISTEE